MDPRQGFGCATEREGPVWTTTIVLGGYSSHTGDDYGQGREWRTIRTGRELRVPLDPVSYFPPLLFQV